MDDVLLPGRVPGSHSFGSRDGDAFSHANELLRSGGPGGGVPGLKQLGRGAAKSWSNICPFLAYDAHFPLHLFE